MTESVPIGRGGRQFAARIRLPSVAGLGALGGGGAALLAVYVTGGLSQPAAAAGMAGCLASAMMTTVSARRAGDERRARAGQLLGLLEQIALPQDHREADDAAGAARPSASVTDWLDRFENAIKATSRVYRSLEVERESSQRLLEKQNSERAKFYARLSHELRTPLNAILGYASLIAEQAEAEGNTQCAGDVKRIRIAGHDLLGLIDNLLDVAEDGGSRTSLERVPFTLARVFADLTKAHGYGRSACELLAEPDAGNQTLFGNREKVTRAIGSLLDDAIRRQDAARVMLSCSVPVSASNAIDICVGVERPAGSRPDAPQQDEVGWQVIDGLARSVGGSVTFEEMDQARARYVLRLPLDIKMNKVPDMNDSPGGAVEISAAGPPVHKTALVIDDDPAAIDLLGRWLKRCGYAVLSAPDAESGLAIAGRQHLDIVLLDALMPGRTGYDILPEMRALPTLQNTPILIVTVDDDRGRGLEAGASDFVRKPVTESELRNLISVYEADQSGDILIIDDDEDAAELLERTVRRLGFTTRRASDGRQGLAKVREKAPRAILMDLDMPNLNGFEFIERMSADRELASIPLIVVSGQDLSIPQHNKLVAAGCRFFLKGNAAPREIAEGLREVLA